MSAGANTLLGDIEAFLRAKGMPQSVFGKAAVNDPSLVGQIRKGIQIGPRREAKVRAFMGTNSPVVSNRLAAEVRREADDAATARLDSTPLRAARLPARLTAGEAIQTMLAETPSDAVMALTRRWPDVWADIVVAARAHDMLPGAMMVDAIEAGLASMGTGSAAA